VLGALLRRLASVLITSKETAGWLAVRPEPLAPPISEHEKRAAAAAVAVETLLDQEEIRGIDPATLGSALTTSLKLLPARVAASESTAPLTEHEVRLLGGGRTTLGRREPGAPDPVARTAAAAATLLAEALTIRSAAARLHTTEDDIAGRVGRRALYAVDGADGPRLPAFQFDGDHVVPGMERLLAVLPPGLHLVELYAWFTNPDPDLKLDKENLSPRDWLLSGGDIGQVARSVESM
jgi:hypothetical protein